MMETIVPTTMTATTTAATMIKATQTVVAAAAATTWVVLQWFSRAFAIRAESGLGELGALADLLGNSQLFAIEAVPRAAPC